jgi:phage-related protein
MMDVREMVFVGGSGEDLRAFPEVARHRAGYALWLVQQGEEPPDWKPMPTVGPGCREIRVRDAGSNAYRVIYVCATAQALWVLHCFQKKSQRTAKADLDLAAARYRAMRAEVAKEGS